MRLLDTETRQIVEFFDEDIPEYAILSHTWGDDEIIFDDCQTPSGPAYSGHCVKIDGCCDRATEKGLGYVWVDTICIDKTSSAELSEALNSMYEWYARAKICLVYLADVDTAEADLMATSGSAFRRSRWFTRGWTLQELLAPKNVEFYSSSWGFLCRKPGYSGTMSEETRNPLQDDAGLISDIVHIGQIYLSGGARAIETASVAMKMSWAVGRQVKRREDRAYSLLGLFGVNMPMLYGEGDRAFQRLLKEILGANDDETIFAGGFGLPVQETLSILSSSPDAFSFLQTQNVSLTQVGPQFRPDTGDSHYFMTNKGLRMHTNVVQPFKFCNTHFALLSVRVLQPIAGGDTVVIPLIPYRKTEGIYKLPQFWAPTRVKADSRLWLQFERTPVYIQPRHPQETMNYGPFFNIWESVPIGHLELMEVYPPDWNLEPGNHQGEWDWVSSRLVDRDEVIYARIRFPPLPPFAMRISLLGLAASVLGPGPNDATQTSRAPSRSRWRTISRMAHLGDRRKISVAELDHEKTSLVDHLMDGSTAWGECVNLGFHEVTVKKGDMFEDRALPVLRLAERT